MMRKTIMAAVVASSLWAGGAIAQTCGAPGSWQPDDTGNPTLPGDTCTGSDDIALYCGALNSTGKLDAVYQVTFAAAGTATSVTVGGGAAGFDPIVAIYSGGCATGDGCVASGEPSLAMDVTGVADGTYFLGVTAAPPNAAGACGAFELTANGSFPVALQNFSVE